MPGNSKRDQVLSNISNVAYGCYMNTQLGERRTVLPPQDLEPMLDLSKFLDHITAPAALLGPDGQTVPLPLEAFNVLVEVAHAMRAGRRAMVGALLIDRAPGKDAAIWRISGAPRRTGPKKR